MEKWYDMSSQDVVDNDEHSDGLALQPSPSFGHCWRHDVNKMDVFLKSEEK